MQIKTDRLAYWYFRLNGFLTIENFILHDEKGGHQRTDIDLIATRFPYRQEALKEYNDTLSWMEDDNRFLQIDKPLAALVEVTSGRCKLNGPWTDREKRNIPRALRALGAIPAGDIDEAADALYETGKYENTLIVLQLIAVGRDLNPDLNAVMSEVEQISWNEIKAFIYDRFDRYRRVKREHPQWDTDGLRLWNFSTRVQGRDEFIQGVEEMAILPSSQRRGR